MSKTASVFIRVGESIKAVTISNSRLADSGCEAFYFPVNRLKGLKVFNSKGNAKRSFKRQKLAAEHGLAPRVKSDGIFEVIFPMGFDKLWGRRDTFKDKIRNNFDDQIGYGYFTQKAVMGKYMTSSEVEDLEKKLCKLFPKDDPCDTHGGNLGHIKGKVVMVDFGDVSHT